MNLQEIAYYWGIVPILFALFFFIQLLFSDIGKNRSNKLLGNYFLFLTITLSCKYTNDVGLDWTLPAILFSPLLTFLVPLLYRYVHYLAQENIQKEAKLNNWVHFGLPAIFLFINVGFYVSYLLLGEDNGFVQSFLDVFEYANFQGFKLLGVGQVILYGVGVFVYLRNYKKELGNFSSFKEGLELQWLNAFTLSFVLAATIFGAAKMKADWVSFFYPAVLFHILYSGFFVIKRNFRLYKLSLEAEFNSKQEEKKIEEEIKSDLEEKYKGSSLRDEEKIQSIKKEILDLMINHKAFMDPSLTVFKMGKELEVNSKYVSQVVNQEFNKNFISFVNEYRVKEVQEMMTEARYENLTLEGMALKAGFKSKSSFNIAFKKEIGMTPSQYRKEMSLD